MTPLPGLTSCVLAMTQHAPVGSTVPLYALQCLARHASQMLAGGGEGLAQVRVRVMALAAIREATRVADANMQSCSIMRGLNLCPGPPWGTYQQARVQ